MTRWQFHKGATDARAGTVVGAVSDTMAKTAALYAPPLEALAALEELNATFPDRFDVHFFLGLTLENQDRAGEALEHFRRALILNPPAH